MAKIYPMGLIISALLILVLPGILYNNFASSGLTPAFALNCPGYPDTTCQNSNTAGCQAQPSQCSLSGTSISILNRGSPFTPIITGNIFGGFSQLNSNGNANHGPFDSSGGGQYYPVNCLMHNAGHLAVNMTTQSFAGEIFGCTQANPDLSNTTKVQTALFNNWNINLTSTTKTIHFYQINNNATYALVCFNQGFYYVTSQPSVGYSTIGCDYYLFAGYAPPVIPNSTPVFSFLLAVPANQATGGVMTGNMPTTTFYHMQAFIQPETWDTEWCTDVFLGLDLFYQSQQCINMETWFTSPKWASGNFQAGFLTPFLAIIIGLVLFLVGLGINLNAGGSLFGSGTTLGAGVNPQGTRLAQTLGMTLMAYAPLYSEFSPWFTSGVLPNGLDGAIGVVGVTITTCLFAGVVWLTLQMSQS